MLIAAASVGGILFFVIVYFVIHAIVFRPVHNATAVASLPPGDAGQTTAPGMFHSRTIRPSSTP